MVNFSKTYSSVILPTGGLNTESSKLNVPPGQMVGCSNVEIADPLGWGRSTGYEPFDGQTRPHLAIANIFTATFISSSSANLEFTSSSGAIGRILADYDSDSVNIWFYISTGSLTTGDTVIVAGVDVCIIVEETTADNFEESKAMVDKAIVFAMDDITEVPGDGDITGVWSYKGNVYTFREDGLVKKMYGSSSAGWVEVVLPIEIPFSNGLALTDDDIPLAGDTVTNGTATADIVAVQKTNAAAEMWTAGEAVGILTVKNITGGTFSDEDDLEFSRSATAVWDGIITIGSSWTDNEDDTYTADSATSSDLEVGTPPLVIGVKYRASFTIDTITTGDVTLPYDGDVANKVDQTTAGTYDHEFIAIAEDLIIHSELSDAIISNIVVTQVSSAVTTDDQEQVTLNVGGRHEFDNYNFSGSADTLNMYGVDGVNFTFQFDGTDYIQIRTGLEDDTPTHIFALNYQLFVSKHGSWLLSALGEPLSTWENIRGSDEWAMGDEIVGAITTPGGTTLSIARNSISIIYPVDESTVYYQIKPYTNDYGGVEWSLQNALYPVLISDGGVVLVPPTDKFGDFETNSVDEVIRDLILGLKESFSCSVVFRNKKEYRMFFTNGMCVRLKFSADSVVGFSVDEYPLVVRGCTASVRSDRYLTDTDIEKDHVFFYSDDGYIRQMDSGNSFHGEEIMSYMELPWNHLGAPEMKKRWYNVTLEIESGGVDVEIGVKPLYNMYDPSRTEVLQSTIIELDLPGGIWSEVNWNEFFWTSSPSGGMYKVRLRSTTPGLGLIIASRGGDPWNIRSITTRYSPRGEVR